MAFFSFIDNGNRDFLKGENGKVIVKEFPDKECAEEWLIDNHSKTDWSNQGTTFWEWE